MRLCCNDSGIGGTYDPTENEIIMKKLHDFGFRVIGVWNLEMSTDDQIKRLKDLAAKYEMVIAVCPTPYQPAHPDPERRKKEHEGCKITLKKMRQLGGDVIHIAGGSYTGEGWWYHPKNFTQQGLDELITEMKKLAPYAEDARISICPETTQWCILNSTERMKEFVDRVDSPYVKVTFDVVNHLIPARLVESGTFFKCALAFLGDRIGMLHIKDAVPVADLVVHINEVPYGTGILDHKTIIQASDNLEPWKTFSLEHFNVPGEGGDCNISLIEDSYKYFKGITDRIGHKWSDPNLTRDKWLSIKNRTQSKNR